MVLNVVNTVLCIIIVILGSLAYNKNHKMPALLISVSFGIFGLSHVVTILGFEKSLMNILIAIRSIAYLFVIFALAIAMKEKQ